MNRTFPIRHAVSITLLAVLCLVPAAADAMRFSHTIHDREGIGQCDRCHLPNALSIIPERAGCLDCHEAADIEETVLGPTRSHTPSWVRLHGPESQSAGARCSSCHQLAFCVDCHKGGELGADLTKRSVRMETVPENHTSRFLIVHPLKATGEQAQQCYSCHTRQDCVDCHENTGRNRLRTDSHRRSWSQIEAGAGGPLHQTFSLNQCQDCHPGGAVSDADWSRDHTREARRSLGSCQACHPDGNECMACHSAKSGLMVSPHPGNWKRIQGKFRRESPEVCDQCH
ncbi:MAG: cytochrome C [bacterium]|nr:cytochrome C [bacterium]